MRARIVEERDGAGVRPVTVNVEERTPRAPDSFRYDPLNPERPFLSDRSDNLMGDRPPRHGLVLQIGAILEGYIVGAETKDEAEQQISDRLRRLFPEQRRDIDILGHAYSLASSEHPGGGWQSRIVRYVRRVPATMTARPLPGIEPDTEPVRYAERGWGYESMTAEAALDSLEHFLKASIKGAVSPQPTQGPT